MHPKYWKRPHVLRAPADSEGGMGAGGESSGLSTSAAADAFSSFFSDENAEESGAQQASQASEESPDAAAERLLAEEAAAANQNSAEEGEKEAGDTYDENETVTVLIDGKKVEITKAQIAEAKKGELRQKDYTQKTMAAAEETKAAQAERAAAKAERDNYAQQLNNFAITSESILAEQAKALTDDLLRSDPVEYLALERTFRERQSNLAKAQAELQRINGEREQEKQQSVQQFIQTQHDKLLEAMPELKDEGKRKETMGAIETFLQSAGFTRDDGLMVLDARLLTMANEAMKYRALLERAKTTQATISKAPPKVERPGTAQIAATDGRTRAIQKLKSSGSINDAASAFGLLD